MAEGSSRRVPLGEAEVFIEVISPAPTLVVVGGAHISIALTAIAKIGPRASANSVNGSWLEGK